MHKFSLINRIRYAFDNFMARGFIALTSGLGIISLIVIIGAATVVIAGGWGPPDDEHFTFGEALWASLLRTLDPGTMGADQGWGFRIIMLLVTLSGISIISTLIGVVNNAIETKLSELRKGRSVVVESGHTLILGWSPQIFTMVKELIISNEHRKDPCIVILADRDKVEMEDELHEKVGRRHNTKIVCRSGNPIDIDDLAIVSPQTSRSIIILPPEGENPDATTLKIILAIVQGKDRRREPYHITAQIHDPRNMDVTAMVGKNEVELVQISDMISRLIAQTCRQSGLSIVYSELLGYDGDEIYFQAEPSLAGRTYGEILDRYIDSAVIGIMPEKGEPMLNPPMDQVFGANDQIIAISENFDTIRLSPPARDSVNQSAIANIPEAEPTPETTLILGWNWRAPAIINELDNYVAPGSTVLLISSESDSERLIAQNCRNLKHQRVSCMLADTTSREVLDEIEVNNFKHIIILSYSDRLEPQEADSVSMITLLHLRDITRKLEYPMSIVSEMLDQRNRALIEVSQADDYIVSNHFISLVVTQISQNKHLNTIFKDLFDADGSEIYLKLASNYIKPGTEVNFYTVLAAARARGETAIGYHLKSVPQTRENLFGIIINPLKSETITFGEWDRIIVLAED
ncbi:MAG: potassium transporter TrkA [Candidatus Riflebacteria bacterium]|nr:potassium transporter TrkA [Candidatus Riflebacteria bacterium]